MLDDVTRARLAAQHVEQAEGGFCETCGSLWEWPCAVRALLTAYDALRLRAENAEQDRDTLRRDLARAGQAVSAAEQARDDFRDSTHEMLGELLEQHQITPEPCPGGPCVANALIAIGNRIKAAEARATRLGALEAAAREMDACGAGAGERFAAAYSAMLAAVVALDGGAGEPDAAV